MGDATQETDRTPARGGYRGRSRKSAAAFRTISEVAGELDVPQHVLRFWETKFAQIRPVKRGGGRRYYRPEDVDLLRRIRNLLYTEGYTIRGVQRLLRDGNGRRARRDAVVPAGADKAVPLPDTAIAELRGLLDDLQALRAEFDAGE